MTHDEAAATAGAGARADALAFGRVAALDGIRGAAVAAVVLYHAGHLRGGYLGVDAFFVLSGFLITSLLVAEHGRTGRISRRQFWARRARRLLPALFLALLGVAVYAAVWARPEELDRLRRETWWTLAYLANWYAIFARQGYWDVTKSALEHTWSLAIEEQFYLLWPMAVALVLGRRGPKRSLRSLHLLRGGSLLGAAALAALMIGGSYAGWDTSTLYLMTFTRAPALLIGAALGATFAIRGSLAVASPRARRALDLAGVGALGLLVYVYVGLDGTDPWLYRGGLLASGVATAVVVACAVQPGSVVARALGWKPLVALGTISYGVYLWHWPVNFVVTPDRTGLGLGSWALVAARVAVTLVLSVASYVLVERPIRRGVLTPRLALTGVAAVPIVIALLVVPATAGARPPSAAPTTGDGALSGPGLTNTCSVDRLVPPLPERVPVYGPRVMVVGDSVGCFIGAEFERNAARYGMTALNRSELGCLLVRPTAARNVDGSAAEVRDACADQWAAARDRFRPDVTMVFVGGLWDYAVAVGGGRFADPCDPGFRAWYAAGARRALDVVAVRGRPVAVVAVPFQPRDAHLGPGVAIPARFNRYVECIDAALGDAVRATPSATLIDLNPLVCPARPCPDTLGGVLLRPDGRHFQGPSARLVADWLAPRVLRLARDAR